MLMADLQRCVYQLNTQRVLCETYEVKYAMINNLQSPHAVEALQTTQCRNEGLSSP